MWWLRRAAEVDDPEQLIQELFHATLCRPATESEANLFLEVLGEEPRREDLQDVLWALCMLPEFWFAQ